jgi:antitoxin (DNA-binding transcriptional repressor) of toxin-antitoxin stability system
VIDRQGLRMETKRAVAAVGMRELEEHLRDVLRRVSEAGEIIDVADNDAIVARIVPADRAVDQDAFAAWWKRHDQLVKAIDEHWPEGLSAADAIADVRREL